MSRPLSVRALSLALSLWLPLFMSGAEWAVHCPAHGGTSAAMSHQASGNQLSGHDHDAEHSAPGDHGPAHTCSCPGPSCCSPAVALTPTVMVPLARVALVHEARAVSTLDLLSTERDHLLPFATAPPAAALAPAALHVA